MEKLRVAIIEPEPVLRERLQKLIDDFPKFTCSNTYSSAHDALRFLPHTKPHIVLTELSFGAADGFALLKTLSASLPATCFIVMHDNSEATTLFRAFKAGARGFLLKAVSKLQLERCLRHAALGELWLPKNVSGDLLVMLRTTILPACPAGKPAGAPVKVLSSLLLEVLELAKTKITQKKMAEKIHLSLAAVKKRCRKICRLLGVKNIHEAVEVVYR